MTGSLLKTPEYQKKLQLTNTQAATRNGGLTVFDTCMQCGQYVKLVVDSNDYYNCQTCGAHYKIAGAHKRKIGRVVA